MDQQTAEEAGNSPDIKKMDALARLSSKLAHDLNNILGAIEGYATLAMGAVKAGDPMMEDMQEIRAAVAKAAALNKQLLVFSGRQMMQKKTCSVNEIINGLPEAAAGSGAAGIELRLQPDLPGLTADPVHLGKAISNLLANAREAMPGGGTVVISSSFLRLEGAAVKAPKPEEAGAGFVKISVKDSGAGISGENYERLFEPLFSTKDKKSGAGLGLSTVYGVVKQHNGWVEAKTEPGRGSEFSVFLPVNAK